jgi:hypothetical protein
MLVHKQWCLLTNYPVGTVLPIFIVTGDTNGGPRAKVPRQWQ